MAAKAMTIARWMDPLRAELLAIKEGLLFAWDLGIRSIHLECDLQSIVSSIAEPDQHLSYNGAIVRGICIYAP